MEVSTIGLDLAKNVFQVHAFSADGSFVFTRSLRRAQVLAFFEALPPCLVGVEVCGASHYTDEPAAPPLIPVSLKECGPFFAQVRSTCPRRDSP